MENNEVNIKQNNQESEKTDYHKVFGMLLIYLRKNGYDLEYSILSNANDINLNVDDITIGVSDNFGYNKLQANISVIEEFMKGYGYGVKILNIVAKEKINVLDLLKEKFGNYLKIIK